MRPGVRDVGGRQAMEDELKNEDFSKKRCGGFREWY
jgi:hypothetical protein